MVEITINKFKDVDIPKLAKFMFDATNNTVFLDDSRTIESIEQSFQEMMSDENEIVLIALNEGEIIGALRVHAGFSEMAFTAKWHPIIHHGETREETAIELIRFGKKYIKGRGFTRFEANLSPIRREHAEVYNEYKSWYEKAGFYRATEEALLQVNLENHLLSPIQPSLLEGFRFESIDNVTNEDIEAPFFDSFTHGRDRLFLDMTTAQQKVSFNFWFRRSRPFHRAAIIALKDNEVVGFNLVRQDDDSAEVGPVGVIPKYHRQGIMKAVLHESLKRLQEDGIKIAQLEADKNNDPAISLYTKFGFEELYSQQYFAWKVV
ncbi:MAG: GNAT family N-acetyltransferase [Candidatus Thorarchaeota archaeon]|nr:MAG: GNAT family N-acetyltransferase [Candidatus Thorarchaeota archaeon]